MHLKGSKTETNLYKALTGEALARIKYSYFASKAKKDGFIQISRIFEETANNEQEHAKIWFKLLYGEIKTTKENLADAYGSEYFEHTKMYPDFARTARKEGFLKIAKLFDIISKVEGMHYERYKKLFENVDKDTVFKKENAVLWECGNCGYILSAKSAPEMCPLCSHPRDYFFVHTAAY